MTVKEPAGRKAQPDAPKASPTLAADPAADPIARGLRDLFRATEQEALPDRFRQLLDRLAEEERR